jgi:hypothetical protein
MAGRFCQLDERHWHRPERLCQACGPSDRTRLSPGKFSDGGPAGRRLREGHTAAESVVASSHNWIKGSPDCDDSGADQSRLQSSHLPQPGRQPGHGPPGRLVAYSYTLSPHWLRGRQARPGATRAQSVTTSAGSVPVVMIAVAKGRPAAPGLCRARPTRRTPGRRSRCPVPVPRRAPTLRSGRDASDHRRRGDTAERWTQP